MQRRRPPPGPRKSTQATIEQTLEDSTARTDQLLRESRALMAATDALLDATASFAKPTATAAPEQVPLPPAKRPPHRAHPARKPDSTPPGRR